MKKVKFKMTENGSGLEKFSESSCLCASVLKKDAGVVEGGFSTETQRRRGTEFKMTEIGPIPEDWDVKPLSSIGIFSKGRGVSRSESNSGVLPCVRYGEIYTDHNDYIKEFKSFISESVAINAKRLVDGDILFAGSGETKEEIGKAVAYLGGAERVYCGGDILVLSPFSDFDSKFLGYVCNSQAAVSQKSARGQGDAVVHIRTSNLAEVLIPVPPLPEQKKIAEALSDVDELLAAMRMLIEKKRAIKQGAMQELLGIRNEELVMRNCGAGAKKVPRRRLPGFSGEWVEKRLGDCGTAIRGVSYKPYQAFYESGAGRTMLLRSNNIQDNVSTFDDVVYVSEECIGDEQYMRCGDILICAANGSRNLVGKSAVLKTMDQTVTFGAFMTIFRANSDIDAGFVGYLFQTESYRKQLDDILTGSAINNLNSKDILDLAFAVPPTLAEQKAIAAVLSDMDAEIAALEAKRAKYESIKQGMMQELLTGRTRLLQVR